MEAAGRSLPAAVNRVWRAPASVDNRARSASVSPPRRPAAAARCASCSASSSRERLSADNPADDPASWSGKTVGVRTPAGSISAVYESTTRSRPTGVPSTVARTPASPSVRRSSSSVCRVASESASHEIQLSRVVRSSCRVRSVRARWAATSGAAGESPADSRRSASSARTSEPSGRLRWFAVSRADITCTASVSAGTAAAAHSVTSRTRPVITFVRVLIVVPPYRSGRVAGSAVPAGR
jgi:hypothetical protein